MTVLDPDRALLVRARRVLGVQLAVAITATLLVVGVLTLVVVVHGQHASTQTLLEHTFTTEDDVIDPPPGVWLFVQGDDGHTEGTPGTPAGFPEHDAVDRVRAGSGTETISVSTGRQDFRVLTGRRDTGTVQIIASLHAGAEEQQRILVALVLAEVAGLAVAFLFAGLLARRATAPLADALVRQRQFVADASHELRTPLTQLHTRAQLLQRDLAGGAADADVAGDVEQLVIGTRHLGEVVEDLLLSTQTPHRPHDLAAVDLAAIATAVIGEQAARAGAQDVTVTLVAGAGGPFVVRGREAALRRVLTALLDNALSHTAGGGHVTVELARDKRLTVVVRDDGSGFDPADAERLFTRFARGHGDHRRFGLGLALAREVVAGHGGTIEAWSRPGRGAAFTIEFP